MTYEDALAEFEAQPPVRVLFDEGGEPGLPPGRARRPASRRRSTPTRCPSTEADHLVPRPRRHAHRGPTHGRADGDDGTVDAYTSDPSARPEVNLVEGEDTWWRLPKYDWQSPAPGERR